MGAFDQRPRFFEGQYLSADDLSAVVDYLRGAQARQALGARTWGIGIGLHLLETAAPGAPSRQEVILQPGWAVDGFGRQIVVQQPTRLPESLFAGISFNAAIDALPAGNPMGRLVKVWLAYTEASGRAPAPGFETCDSTDASARIEESFTFVVGEFAATSQRAPVVIGAQSVDAAKALQQFDPAAPLLYDTSVPHQTFPGGDKPPRWLLPVGQVRWVAGNGVLGYFIDRGHDPAAHVEENIRAFRHYGGSVVQNIEASDGAIVMRARSADPSAVHRFAYLLQAGQTLAQLLEDVVWVEGGLRVEGDAKLAGSRLLLRNADGLDEGNALYLARAGDGSGLPGQRELRAVIGSDAQTDNRFVVGPEQAAAPGQQAPQLVVLSNGQVGINNFDPACTVHARGDAIRLEDSASAKRLEMRSDGPGVELRSDTNRLYLRATGPDAQQANRVLINPDADGGRVGIGVEDPQSGLDVHQATVGFTLNRQSGGGGRLLLRNDTSLAATESIFLEASVAAGGAPSPELRITGPNANLPLFAAHADLTYLGGRVGINERAPAADTQVHVRGTRIRLQSVDGTRSVDLRADGGAVDLQSTTHNLYLRATDPAEIAPRHILMNPLAGDGNVGIGLEAPTEKLHVHGRWLRVNGSGAEAATLGGEGHNAVTVGSLSAAVSFADMRNLTQSWNTSNASAWLTVYCRSVIEVSDAHAKTDVRAITGALEQVSQLRGVAYQWVAPGARAEDGERLGLIAQEVRKVVPQAVSRNERGEGISYSSLVPLLIEAIKELRSEVQALKAQARSADKATAAPVDTPAFPPATAPQTQRAPAKRARKAKP